MFDGAMPAAALIPHDPDGFGVTMTATDFRSRIGEAMDTAQREPVTVTHRGRPRAVLVSAEFYERAMTAVEDIEDLAAVAASRDDTEPTVTLAELRAELGLTDVGH